MPGRSAAVHTRRAGRACRSPSVGEDLRRRPSTAGRTASLRPAPVASTTGAPSAALHRDRRRSAGVDGVHGARRRWPRRRVVSAAGRAPSGVGLTSVDAASTQRRAGVDRVARPVRTWRRLLRVRTARTPTPDVAVARRRRQQPVRRTSNTAARCPATRGASRPQADDRSLDVGDPDPTRPRPRPSTRTRRTVTAGVNGRVRSDASVDQLSGSPRNVDDPPSDPGPSRRSTDCRSSRHAVEVPRQRVRRGTPRRRATHSRDRDDSYCRSDAPPGAPLAMLEPRTEAARAGRPRAPPSAATRA